MKNERAYTRSWTTVFRILRRWFHFPFEAIGEPQYWMGARTTPAAMPSRERSPNSAPITPTCWRTSRRSHVLGTRPSLDRYPVNIAEHRSVVIDLRMNRHQFPENPYVEQEHADWGVMGSLGGPLPPLACSWSGSQHLPGKGAVCARPSSCPDGHHQVRTRPHLVATPWVLIATGGAWPPSPHSLVSLTVSSSTKAAFPSYAEVRATSATSSSSPPLGPSSHRSSRRDPAAAL